MSSGETEQALSQSLAFGTRPTCVHWCGEKRFRSAHNNCPLVFVYSGYTCISNPPAVDVSMAAESYATEHRSVLASGNRIHISGSLVTSTPALSNQHTRHSALRPRRNCSRKPTGGHRVSYPKRAPSAHPPQSMYRPTHAHTLQWPAGVVGSAPRRSSAQTAAAIA